MTTKGALEIRGLRVHYGLTEAVRGIDVDVGPGEAVAVIGSNGAGKTSMLQALMGLAPATAASVSAFGENLLGLPTHRLARRGIGYVPEGRELFPDLTVEEELLIGMRLIPPAGRPARLEELFTLFPRLRERRAQITRTLSGGEQQMVAIARALTFRPRLLLLDEPSLGLAPVIQDAVYAALATLNAGGMSMLLVEQNAYRALTLCRRAYVLEHGEVTSQGPADALLHDPAVRAAFLGA